MPPACNVANLTIEVLSTADESRIGTIVNGSWVNLDHADVLQGTAADGSSFGLLSKVVQFTFTHEGQQYSGHGALTVDAGQVMIIVEGRL